MSMLVVLRIKETLLDWRLELKVILEILDGNTLHIINMVKLKELRFLQDNLMQLISSLHLMLDKTLMELILVKT